MLTFQTVIDLNSLLDEKQLPFHIHLSDACGGTSLWIERKSDKDVSDELVSLITAFFKDRWMEIRFSESRHSFWTV